MVKLIKIRWSPSFTAFVIAKFFKKMLMYKVDAITKQIVRVMIKANVEIIWGLCDELFKPFCWTVGCSSSEESTSLLISWTWFLILFHFSFIFSKAMLPT